MTSISDNASRSQTWNPTMANRFGRMRELIAAWTGRIIRARYQQSLMGGLWVVFRPITQVIIFTVIFARFLNVQTDAPYPVFTYVAMIPWTFFSTATTDMVTSIVTNMSIINKIYFPREILPFSAMLARLLDFAIGQFLLIFLLMIYQQPFYWQMYPWLILIVIVQMMLMLGIGLAGAAVNIFFRDVTQIIGLIVQLWFYASPIVYPIERVPEQYRTLYFLNPMAGVLEAYRAVILRGEMPDASFALAALVSAVALAVGFTIFKRLEFAMADIV